MQTARAWGVTPSAFDALPEVDQVEMLALHQYESSLCSHCSLEAKYALDGAASMLVDDFVCMGCRAVAMKRRALEAEYEKFPALLDGLRLSVRPKTEGGHADDG